jgi:NADH dehydrogenase/putative oxidoreductase
MAELARTGFKSEYRAIDQPTTRVILVQSARRIVPVFSSTLSARAEPSCREPGVDVRTDAKVTDIDEDGMEINGIQIAARATTFRAAGVTAQPASKWLGRSAVKSGHVVVNGNLAVQDRIGVFAIGDRAASNGWAGADVAGLAPAAKQRGRQVANVIRAAIKGHAAPEAFQYCHYGNLATVGRLASIVAVRSLRLCGGAPPGGSGASPACCFSPEYATAVPCCSTGFGLT